MKWIIFFSVILIVGLILFAGTQLRKPRPPRCPQCGGKKLSVIGQKLLGTRHFTTPRGEHGFDTFVQQQLNIKYHCSTCEHQFNNVVTQTNT